jgi:hypothetical protein
VRKALRLRGFLSEGRIAAYAFGVTSRSGCFVHFDVGTGTSTEDAAASESSS